LGKEEEGGRAATHGLHSTPTFKLQESPQIKGEVNILRGEKHFNIKDSFLCDSIFSPSIIPFQKSMRKYSYLFLDRPLAWQYT
jgi:hypothetical protein